MPALKNAKHEAFVRAIVEGKTGREAYRAAGYKAGDASADSNASRLLKIAEVSARIAELKAEAAAGAVMSGREVLEELTRLGRANMQDFMSIGADGAPRLDWSALSRDQAAALAEVTVEEFTDSGDAVQGQDHKSGPDAGRGRPVRRIKFRLWDKRQALVDLAKYHQLFREQVQHTGKLEIAWKDADASSSTTRPADSSPPSTPDESASPAS